MSFVGTTWAVTSPAPENWASMKSVSTAKVRAVGLVSSSVDGPLSVQSGKSNGTLLGAVAGPLEPVQDVLDRGVLAGRDRDAGAAVGDRDVLQRTFVLQDPVDGHGLAQLLGVDLVDGARCGRKRECGGEHAVAAMRVFLTSSLLE